MIRRAFSAIVLLYLLGYAMFAVALPRPADERGTDAIVVLTGGAKRIERGLDLMARNKAKRMLVSGVARTVRPEELAAQYRADDSLFQCCVDLGRESVDTRSNAEEVARWMDKHKFRSMRLVTTDWHMRRARFELDQSLPDGVVIRMDGVRSDPDLRVLLSEYHKYLLRRLAVLFGL